MTSPKVAIVSGGLDSTVLAYKLAAAGGPVQLVSFDYGQRHRVELDYAEATANRIGARWNVVDLRTVTALLTGCSLTDRSVPVPAGHYAEASMRSTVVPNRNMMMLSIAAAVAIATEATSVATAIHAGDHFIYPDCRPGFVVEMTAALRAGNEGFCHPGFTVDAPFVNMTKADIVAVGADLGVPFELTWSCYEGKAVHCGACGTCFERREAFTLADVPDPTNYLSTPTYEEP